MFEAEVRYGRFATKVYVWGNYGLTKATEIGKGRDIYYDANCDKWMRGRNELSQQLTNSLRV